jgi:DnaK suppressor protein
LKRIENGTYGYCKDTGEPIGIGRLETRPEAELCGEAQARHEKEESLRRN